MSDEKLANAFQEGRLIAAADNVIYPMIDLMIENAIGRLTGEYRAGKTDFMSGVAYIVALQDLQSTLKQKQEAGRKAFAKLNPS